MKALKAVPECLKCLHGNLAVLTSCALLFVLCSWAYSAVMGAGLSREFAMVTDGRFLGGSHGFITGHITPEAQVGGPIALVKNGDKIKIDAKKRIDLIDRRVCGRTSAAKKGVGRAAA
ncbi:hypothetical protein PsorP6_012065 [Peronosclerospora sorghi]|uniref:Uncharacterized protein n=1 Tax=Peronosclerospora sorghi TaxID=230839 RepID=A0ACC0WJ70_9STRA|nr:hypothetical protein PsorP6_012065 [Peronosclerospora sorghi]